MGNLTNFIHPSARVGAKNTKEGLGLGAGDRPDSFQSFIIKSKLTSFSGRRGSKPRVVRQMQTNPKIPEKSKVHKNSWVRNRQKMRWALTGTGSSTSSRWTQSERGGNRTKTVSVKLDTQEKDYKAQQEAETLNLRTRKHLFSDK